VTCRASHSAVGRRVTSNHNSCRGERKPIIVIGETHNVDCVTGDDLRPPLRADAGTVSIGEIKRNGFLRVVNVRASSGNPFYTALGVNYAPKIDFEMVIEYNAITTALRIKGTTGEFPALEGYYEIGSNSGTLFALNPVPGSTAASLVDFATGINMRNFEANIDLTPYFVN
jgi:hypothetical protein